MAAVRFTAVALAALLAACEQGPRQISRSGYGAFETSLATWENGLAVAWYDMRDGNAEIYARFLDAAGGDLDTEWRLTTTAEQSYEADIAALDESTLVIAWYEKTPGGSMRAQLGAWGRDRSQLWRRPLDAPGFHSRNPIVRPFGGALFAAWIAGADDGAEYVYGGWFERDGQARGEAVRLGRAGPTTWNLNGAVSAAGVAVVVFDALVDTRAEELYLATLADGAPTLERITADDDAASKYPDIALREDAAALTWFVYGVGVSGGSLSYALLSTHFAPALSGRVTTTLNLLLFVGAFSLQWGLGVLIDGLLAAGQTAAAAYRSAFIALLLLQAAGYAWFLLERRRK